MKNTRVLIVDDHGVLRAGLRALLEVEKSLDVIGEAGSGEEALELAKAARPDIVLMDISLPKMSGIEATRKLVLSNPSVRVLILTVHEDKSLLQEAIRAGASGYILKRAVKSELLSAIDAIGRGDLYVHPSMTRALLPTSPLKKITTEGSIKALTPREIDVLRLIAHGYTNSQIGKQLNISVRTVEYHRGNLMGKLYLDSRVELVRFAAENGLLENKSGLQTI